MLNPIKPSPPQRSPQPTPHAITPMMTRRLTSIYAATCSLTISKRLARMHVPRWNSTSVTQSLSSAELPAGLTATTSTMRSPLWR